jgi:HlyD family secretion protein
MRPHRTRRRSFAGKLLILLLALGAGGTAVFLWKPWRKHDAPAIPTGEVRLGEFVDTIQLRGEIRVRSSTTITAPTYAGELQILKLCRDGTMVQKGDVVAQFDPASIQRQLDQYRSALKQVEAEIARANAQQRIREEQSLTNAMMAQFGLERARLDASARDVLPAIENEKNRLALEKAEQKMREIEVKKSSDKIGAEADQAAIMRRRDKARADLADAERNLKELTLTAPADGLVILMPNYRARTSFAGGATPVFRDGDRIWAGATIAELPQLDTVQANAPLEEADRGRIQLGQPVAVRVDALPDAELKGSVGGVGTLAKVDYSSRPIRKNFDITIQIDRPDPRLRPGMSATLRIAVERVPDSVLIPPQAAFERSGRMVAYVLVDGAFQERALEIARRSEGQILVGRGLKPGERVALKDPAMPGGQK